MRCFARSQTIGSLFSALHHEAITDKPTSTITHILVRNTTLSCLNVWAILAYSNLTHLRSPPTSSSTSVVSDPIPCCWCCCCRSTAVMISMMTLSMMFRHIIGTHACTETTRDENRNASHRVAYGGLCARLAYALLAENYIAPTDRRQRRKHANEPYRSRTERRRSAAHRTSRRKHDVKRSWRAINRMRAYTQRFGVFIVL